MTAFLAEARRLGINIPEYVPSSSRVSFKQYDDEGLCVSNCVICRDFRNEVRAALELEAATQTGLEVLIAELNRRFNA